MFGGACVQEPCGYFPDRVGVGIGFMLMAYVLWMENMLPKDRR